MTQIRNILKLLLDKIKTFCRTNRNAIRGISIAFGILFIIGIIALIVYGLGTPDENTEISFLPQQPNAKTTPEINTSELDTQGGKPAPSPPASAVDAQSTSRSEEIGAGGGPHPSRIEIISDPPDANIQLEGSGRHNQYKRIGKTPFIDSLQAGNYEITIKKKCYQERKEIIHLRPGATKKLSATLDRLPNILSVTVTPTAEIRIGNEGYFTSPRPDIVMPGGWQEVKVKHPVHGLWEDSVYIKECDTTRLHIDFDTKAYVTVTSDPPNATIMADGEVVRDAWGSAMTTNNAKVPIRIGWHKMDLFLPGYTFEPKTFNIRDSQTMYHFDFQGTLRND